MKKMIKFVKGRRDGDEVKDERRSNSSLGSRSSPAPSSALQSSSSLSNVGGKTNLDHLDSLALTPGGRSPSTSSSVNRLRIFKSNWSLSQAEEGDSTKLHQAASAGHVEKISKRLKTIDVDHVDAGGRTALHVSSGAGHLRAVTVLLENQADANLQDNDGKTALTTAVEEGQAEVAKLLIQHGAAFDIPDNSGETVVHAAVRSGERGLLRLVVRRGGNPDIINYSGQSPLHLAAAAADVESVNILLRAGAQAMILP